MTNPIWSRIELALDVLDLSARKVSLDITEGRNPDILRTIKDGRVKAPSGPILLRLANRLGVSPEWIIDGTGYGPQNPDVPRQSAYDLAMMRKKMAVGPSQDPPVPVLGSVAASILGAFQLTDPVEHVRRPPGLEGARNAYAVYVVGDSMLPRFRQGDLIFVSPDRPPRPGDDVVIQSIDHAGEPPRCYVKQLVNKTSSRLLVEQFNPPATIEIPQDTVVFVHKILSTAELVGA